MLAAYQERLPGCRTFLANFFLTSADYPPEINYLNYVRDIRPYSPSNRHIRENPLSLVKGFYEITGITPATIEEKAERASAVAARAPQHQNWKTSYGGHWN